MPRYKLTIAYDGADFCGWQRQVIGQDPDAEEAVPPTSALRCRCEPEQSSVDEVPAPTCPEPQVGGTELRTVQGVLQRAVLEVVREPVVVKGASRTDSGVHARAQVAAFTTSENGQGRGWPADRGTEPLVRAINSRLPDDVLIRSAQIVAPDFNPIGGCTSKAYTYTFHVSRDRPLWDRRYVHHVWTPLDVAKMREAAAALVGEHDFAAFAAAGHGRLTTVRTVFDCSVAEGPAGAPADADQRIVVTVAGSGFLWHMVRIIAGTLFEAGRGKMPIQQVHEALATGDRRKAGPTLPACGLCLEWVRYGEHP